jgi:hypothetical protein
MLLKTKRNDQKNEPKRSPNKAIYWPNKPIFWAEGTQLFRNRTHFSGQLLGTKPILKVEARIRKSETADAQVQTRIPKLGTTMLRPCPAPRWNMATRIFLRALPLRCSSANAVRRGPHPRDYANSAAMPARRIDPRSGRKLRGHAGGGIAASASTGNEAGHRLDRARGGAHHERFALSRRS